MICFRINIGGESIIIAQANNDEELLKEEVTAFTTKPIRISLKEALSDDYFILSDKQVSNIESKNYTEILDNREDYPIQLIAEIETDSISSNNILTEEVGNLPINEVEPTYRRKTSNKLLSKFKTFWESITKADGYLDANKNLRIQKELIESNPSIWLFNNLSSDMIFKPIKNSELIALRGQIKDYKYDYLSSKEFKESLGKEAEKVTGGTTNDTFGWDELAKYKDDWNLVLVDKQGNFITHEDYIVRTFVTNVDKKLEEQFSKGLLFSPNTNDLSQGVPVLHEIGKYTKFKDNSEIIDKANLKIQVNPNGNIQQGTVFFKAFNDRPDSFSVQIDFPTIEQSDYVNILSNIINMMDNNNYTAISKAWNVLVKHGSKSEQDESFYHDYMSPLTKAFTNYQTKEVYDNGLVLELPYKDSDRPRKVFIVKTVNGIKTLVYADKKFIEVSLNKVAELIQEVTVKDSNKTNIEKSRKVNRKFSPPIQKRSESASEVSPYANIDMTEYANIFGIKAIQFGKEVVKETITPIDMIKEFGRTRVRFDRPNTWNKNNLTPLIYNQVFEIIPAKIETETIGEQIIQAKEEIENKNVEIPKKRKVKLGVERSKTIQQLGKQITQEDIDNIKRVFPSLEDREIKLLAATAQTDYWARVTKKGLELTDYATTGTLYHESWHEFSQWYMTKSEKSSLYNQVENITGISDRLGQEEFLAEEFSKFRLGLPINNKLQKYFDKETNWFNKILAFIKNLLFNEKNILTEFENLGLVLDGKKKLKYFSENNVEFDTLNKAIEKDNGEVVFKNEEFIDVVKVLDTIIFETLQSLLDNKNDGLSPYTKTSVYTPDYIASDEIKKDNYKHLAILLKKNLKPFIDEGADDYGVVKKILDNFDLIFNEYVKKTDMPFKNISGVELDGNGNIKEVENIEGTRNKGNLLEGNETTIHQDISVLLKSIIKSLKQPIKNFSKEQYENIKNDPDLEFDYYKTLKYIGYAERVNMSQTITKIYMLVEGTNSYSDMLIKLEAAAPDNSELWELLDKLPTKEQLAQGNNKALDIASKFESQKRIELAFFNTAVHISNDGIATSVFEAEKNNLETIKLANINNFQDNNYEVKIDNEVYTSLDSIPNLLELKDKVIISDTSSVNFLKDKANDPKLETRLTLLELSGISLSEGFIKNLIKDKAFRSLFNTQIDILFFDASNGFNKLRQFEDSLNKTVITETTKSVNIGGVWIKTDNIEDTKIKFNDEIPFRRLVNLNRQLKLTVAYKSINWLFEQESKFSNLQYTTVVKNANGDLVNTMFMFNGIAQMLTALNDDSLKSIQEIVIKYPYMEFLNGFLDKGKRTLLTGNEYLSTMFDKNGNRLYRDEKIKTIKWQNIGGHISEENGENIGEGSSTKLNEIDKLIQNLVMDSSGERLTRPGDKSTETRFVLDGLSYYGIKHQDTINKFMNHLLNESYYVFHKDKFKETSLKQFGYLNKTIKSLITDDITWEELETKINAEEIWNEIKSFIVEDVKDFRDKLDRFELNKHIDGISIGQKLMGFLYAGDNDLNSAAEKFIIKKHLNSINQDILFYGYTGMFSDKFKRNSDIYSTGIMCSVDKYLIDGINTNVKNSYTYIEQLKAKNSEFKNRLNDINKEKISSKEKLEKAQKLIDFYYDAQLVEDLKIKSDNPQYNTKTIFTKGNSTVTDNYDKPSQHYQDIKKSFLEALQNNRLPNFDPNNIENYQSSNTADAQAWCSLDFYRTFKIMVGKWDFNEQEEVYKLLSLGIELDQEIKDKINTFFPPVKPQYAGYTPNKTDSFQGHAFDKMSFNVFIPQVYKGTEFEKIGLEMALENIGYVMTKDANKVTLDDKDGRRYFAFLKEQVNIEAHDHDISVFPTQLRQIISGFSKDLDGKWLKDLEDIVKNYDKYSKQLSDSLRKELKEELGINDLETTVDKTKLKKLIDKELTSRDFPSPIIEAVDMVEGNFVYDLETVLAKQTLTNIITSIVNRKLIRIQVNGDMLVQISSHYLDKPGQKDSLLFYKLGSINGKRQTLPATVKLGLRGQWIKLLKFKDEDGNQIETRERLNELLRGIKEKLKLAAINNTQFSEWELNFMKATTMTGVRIPTQGMNSMEVFQVEEFYDSLVGGMLVVPEEITTKAGSDFDIDKLVLMYPETDDFGYVKYDTPEQFDRQLQDLLSLKKTYKEAKNQSYKELKQEQNRLKSEIRSERGNINVIREFVKGFRQQISDLKIQLEEIYTEQADNGAQLDLYEGNLKGTTGDLRIEIQSAINRLTPINQENVNHIRRIKDEIDENYEFLNELKDNVRYSSDLIWTGLGFKEVNKLTNDLVEILENDLRGLQFGYLIDSFNFKDEYSIVLANIRNINKWVKNPKKATHNHLNQAIKDLTLHPLRYAELVYPNNTDIIGAVEKLDDPKLEMKDRLEILNSSVNKLEIKRYYELYKDKFTKNGVFNVNSFLAFVFEDRKNVLNTAYDKANTQKAEDYKFKNGLGTKGLVGIAALQVTMINLISNFNVAVKENFTIEGKDYKLPTIYFTQEFKDKWLQNGILNFSPTTDIPTIKKYDEEFKVVDSSTKSYLKRTLAEQMVNPMVDSLNDKNPISQININGETLATVSFMTTYLGINSEMVYYLLNQPLVLEHIRNKQTNNSKLINRFRGMLASSEKKSIRKPVGEKMIREIIKEIIGKNVDKEEVFNKLMQGDVSIDLNNMFYNIGKPITKNMEQLQHLSNWVTFEKLAEEYRQLQSATNWSTNTQTSYINSQSKIRELKNVKEKAIFTNIDKIEIESVVSNFRVQQLTSNILKQLFDVTTTEEFTRLALSYSDMLNSKSRDKFTRLYSNDFFKFILDNFGNIDLSKELFKSQKNSPINLPSTNVVKDLIHLKKDNNYKDNLFLQSLYINSTSILDNLEVRAKNKEIDTSEAISDGIDQLVLENPIKGKQLIYLGLLQDGLNKSPISFSHYIRPNQYAKELEFAFDKFRNLSENVKNQMLEQYSYLFFKNNPSLLKAANNIWIKVIKYSDYGKSYEGSDEVNAIWNYLNETYNLDILNDKPITSGFRYKDYKVDSPNNRKVSNIKLKEISVESVNKTYKENITTLKDNQIFVFGSNPIGVNGNIPNNTGGAALVALKNNWVKQGEKMDNKLSDIGKSYGIVTVSAPGKKKSKTENEIIQNIKTFYNTALQNPNKEFLIAYNGKNPSKVSLNGYSAKEVANMFGSLPIPSNVVFEESFDKLVRTNTQLTKTQQSIKDIFKGQTTINSTEALKNLIESNSPSSKLVEHLLKFNIDIPITLKDSLEKDGKKVGGLYYPTSNKIELNSDVENGKLSFESNMLHEIIHSIVDKKLQLDSEANKKFVKLYEEAKKQLPNEYATSNIDEFMTGIFTNGYFINKLKQLKPIDISFTSLYNELVDLFLGWIGLNKGDSLYEQAINVGLEVMDLNEKNINENLNSFESFKDYIVNTYDINKETPLAYKYLIETPNIKKGERTGDYNTLQLDKDKVMRQIFEPIFLKFRSENDNQNPKTIDDFINFVERNIDEYETNLENYKDSDKYNGKIDKETIQLTNVIERNQLALKLIDDFRTVVLNNTKPIIFENQDLETNEGGTSTQC